MKIALVHDYIKDFGGAERVLRNLADMYPEAPIYTAFKIDGSPADARFKDRDIRESGLAWLIRPWRLYSPLRFLLPWIWKSIDLSEYDLVITSCSNYVARGFRTSKKTKVIAYCHTPPRFLYGYQTGKITELWPVKIYASLIAHFLRPFDYKAAMRVDTWIANSKNVQKRIQKFYRKDSTVIYPPIEVKKQQAISSKTKRKDFYLITSRLVGTKGLEEAVKATTKLGIPLKIAGGTAGYMNVKSDLEKIGGRNVEFLGRVTDKKLWELYAGAKGFIALARDEDFGMTVVEAQAAGTPVIAFNGGGFPESVINGKTGLLIDGTDVDTLKKAFEDFEKKKWNHTTIKKHAQKFSRERFEKEIKTFMKHQVRHKKHA